MSNPLKKTMVYLGLADEELEHEEPRTQPQAAAAPTPVVHAAPAPAPKTGAAVTPLRKNHVQPSTPQAEMNEILTESGSRLNGALLRAGLVDELVLYFAPHLLGDTARGMFDLRELTALDQRVALDVVDMTRIGPDLRLIARVAEPKR